MGEKGGGEKEVRGGERGKRGKLAYLCYSLDWKRSQSAGAMLTKLEINASNREFYPASFYPMVRVLCFSLLKWSRVVDSSRTASSVSVTNKPQTSGT